LVLGSNVVVQILLKRAFGGAGVGGSTGDGVSSWVSGFATSELAVSSLSNVVRISRVQFETVAVLDGVDVSIMRPATVASVVGVSASRALLNREDLLGRTSDVLRDGVETLEGLIGRVGPARTALALVLDSGNDTLGSPVDSISRDGSRSDLILGRLSLGHVLHQALRKLFVGHVSKGVDTKDLGSTDRHVVSVLVGNLSEVLREDFESVFHLNRRLVNAVIVNHELVELNPVVVGIGSHRHKSDEKFLHLKASR